MPNIDLHMLLNVLLPLIGGFVFLHLVANEKHRRDRWLAFRREEKLKETQHNTPES